MWRSGARPLRRGYVAVLRSVGRVSRCSPAYARPGPSSRRVSPTLSSSLLVLLALAALLVGPGLAWVWARGKAWRSLVDGLSLALVGGICLLLLLPHAIETAGVGAIVAAGVGMLTPAWTHRLSGRWERTFAWAGLALLAVHAAIDGAALAWFDGDTGAVMGAAVVAHRLPMGLAVYSEAQRTSGRVWGGFAAVLVLMVATVVGFAAGRPLAEAGGPVLHGIFEAFVAGVLLHIVFDHAPVFPSPGEAAAIPHKHHHGRDHDHDHGHSHGHSHSHGHGHGHGHGHAAPPPPPKPVHGHSHGHAHHSAREVAAAAGGSGWSAVGVLSGAVVVGLLTRTDTHHDHGVSVIDTLWMLTLESAPALLLGYLLAGLAVAFIPAAGAGWLHGRTSAGSALRGVLFGLPLPVCSCGVLPLYDTLVRRGAPIAAAMAFLVATPELGLDAVLLSVPLLGLPLTVARVVAAFLVAFLVAVLVGRHLPAHECTPDATTQAPAPLGQRLQDGLSYGFKELVDHTMPWVGLGLVAAALAAPVLSSGWLVKLPAVLQVPLFAIVGIPVYVCATGATPLAAVMVQQGVSAGAALALLIAGPATNITTFGVLTVLHGRKVALRFGLAVVGLAIVAGLTVDAIGVAVPLPTETEHDHDHGAHLYQLVAVGLLGLVVAGSLFRQGARGVVAQILEPVET